jgi:hypothetical protein
MRMTNMAQDWILNCSINDFISTTFQRSMTFALRKENTVIPLTLNCLSVAEDPQIDLCEFQISCICMPPYFLRLRYHQK